MLCLAVVAIHETDEIFLIERSDVYSFFCVKAVNEIGVFDNHHPSCATLVNQIVRQPPLVFARELVLGVCRELAVIRRAEEILSASFQSWERNAEGDITGSSEYPMKSFSLRVTIVSALTATAE